jgi:anhydro-N-acetylmuramic acid kinase
VGEEKEHKSTLQIGEAAVIAARTGITTIADFRMADVAVGGQGAPLTSYVDWLLLRIPTHTRAVQNIGGIANVTYLPPDEDPASVMAFDTGPGNMLIDSAASRATDGAWRLDYDGALAAQGRVDTALLNQLLQHPYLKLLPPKTTGREQFGTAFAEQTWNQAKAQGLRDQDIVATLTEFTAASIADGYQRFLPSLPDDVVLGGGGASNPALVAALRRRLASSRVTTHTALGFSDDAKEAVAFAILAYESIHGRPGNLPTCTGAQKRVVLGKITPGANLATLLGTPGGPT